MTTLFKNIVVGCNDEPMLEVVVRGYIASGLEKAALQEYDAYVWKAFILLYIVTGLISQVHEKGSSSS